MIAFMRKIVVLILKLSLFWA